MICGIASGTRSYRRSRVELTPTGEEGIASGTHSYRRRRDREWNSLLQEKKGSRVELAPTGEVDGERAGGAYYFVSIFEILR